jgi:cell division protein FtsA
MNQPRPKLAVGVDAGSSRTRCVICEIEDGEIRFLGAGSAPAHGWNRGRIDDAPAMVASIKAAVEEAETKAQVLVESVTVGVGGPAVEAVQGRGVYEFSRPRQLETSDLTYAVELASRANLAEDRMLVHVLPQDFALDGKPGYKRPVGAECSRLEAHAQLVTISTTEHQRLVQIFHQAHLAVEETVFEPIAAAYASILPEERSRGVALVDLGAHSTGVAIYDSEALVGSASLPVSADHLTRDVTLGLRMSYGLTVSYEDAEVLKREYGCAMLGLSADNTIIEVPSPEGRSSQEITRRQLNEILEARAEEVFRYVRRELMRAGMENSLLEGVTLTGGGARLQGMCDLAEMVLNVPAKYGLAVGIENWPETFDDPAWTTAAGLAMYSGRLRMRRAAAKRKAPGPFGLFGW